MGLFGVRKIVVASALVISLWMATDSQAKDGKIVKVEAVDYKEKIIYHSPETPGYTSWVGLWDLTDGRIQCDFRQITGPKDKPVSSVPLLESKDQGQTWRVVPRDVSGQGTGGGGIYQMGQESGRGMEVLDKGKTLVRAVWPAADLIESGYTLQSTDGGKTWGDQVYPLPKDTWRVWPTLIRKLRDGRLVLLAGCWRRGEMTKGSAGPRILRKMMFVSADKGRTWDKPIELLTPEEGVCEESDFAELPNGDLFWVHRSELYPDQMTELPPGAARSGSKPPESNWYSVRNQSIVRKKGGTFVPEKPTPAPFPHSGYPLVLGVSDNVILHLATDGVYWTADVGQTWQRLNLPGTSYYPKGLLLSDAKIIVIGHVGSDDVYGTVDQSIRQQTFQLKVTRAP